MNSPVSNFSASVMKPLDTCEVRAQIVHQNEANPELQYQSIQLCYIFLNYSTCGTFNNGLPYSKSEDNRYTSIEEIKRLKVQELKTILSDHGQPVTGKKADLVTAF